MPNKAIIVENRSINGLDEIIQGHLQFLPGWEHEHIKDVKISSLNDYNALMTSISFWDKYTEYDRVLIFQSDSMLLREGIDEFLKYDYIGAPIKHCSFPAMNGGLSIRNPRKMIECLEKHPWKTSNLRMHNEDIYFPNTISRIGGVLPTKEVASMFSVETVFKLGTLGMHAAYKYLSKDEYQQLKKQYIANGKG